MNIEAIIGLLRNNSDPRKISEVKRLWPELGNKLESLIEDSTPKPAPGPSRNVRPNDVGKRVLDFSAGFPSAQSIKSGGFIGVVHYVSDRRPKAEWMKAKPVTKQFADSLKSLGLTNVSNFQFGKAETSDWLFGYDNGVKCAKRALELHKAAGGPDGAVIYASIDAAPSPRQIQENVIPYLKGFASVVGKDKLGVYANSIVIDVCLNQLVGKYFWQHKWHENKGLNTPHPAAHLFQDRIDKDKVDGIGVDINIILKEDYGQW